MDRNAVITILYVALQSSVAIFVSIVGAIHVHRCLKEVKNTRIQMEETVELNMS